MRDTAGEHLSQSDIEKNLSADDAKILGQKLGELDAIKVTKLQTTLQKEGKTLN